MATAKNNLKDFPKLKQANRDQIENACITYVHQFDLNLNPLYFELTSHFKVKGLYVNEVQRQECYTFTCKLAVYFLTPKLLKKFSELNCENSELVKV